MARKITVTEYDPAWEERFRSESKKIKKLLGRNCTGVHHIGSTAVKGMCAKPIIDMMAVVKSIEDLDVLNREFEALGYDCMGENGIVGRRFYAKGGDERTYHLHVYQLNDLDNTERHVALCDYLKEHKEEAKEYSDLKSRLAAEYSDDPEGYCEAKSAYVKELESRAIKWQRTQNRKVVCIALGMCIGSGLGCCFGAAYGNMAIGVSIGVSIGVCLGTALGFAVEKKG